LSGSWVRGGFGGLACGPAARRIALPGLGRLVRSLAALFAVRSSLDSGGYCFQALHRRDEELGTLASPGLARSVCDSVCQFLSQPGRTQRLKEICIALFAM
jgi:hypothetical protein